VIPPPSPLPFPLEETKEAAPASFAVPAGFEPSLPDDAPRILVRVNQEGDLPVREFEGPLDLLLHLIRKNQMDIRNIQIAPITRQYIEYLELMRDINLEVAGEFMVMAATLIHIKSKMLVPVSPADVEEEGEDPRERLVQKLLEFERYKQAAGVLRQQYEIRSATFFRPDAVIPKFDDEGSEELIEAGLFDLVSAFRDLLERRKLLVEYDVETEKRSLDQAIEDLIGLIPEGGSLEFTALFENVETKQEMILMFLALLEIVRLKRVKVFQRGIFGAIRVFRPVGPDEPPVPARAP
jgi:segregation and condensation protein A